MSGIVSTGAAVQERGHAEKYTVKGQESFLHPSPNKLDCQGVLYNDVLSAF